MADYFFSIAGICLASILFFIVTDGIGNLVSQRLGTKNNSGNLLYGLWVVVGMAAILVTKGITIFLFPLFLILWLIFKSKDRIYTGLQIDWYESALFSSLIVINALIRFWMLYNPKTGTLFTDYTDQYNYIDQVNLLLMYRKEVDFLGLESELFGEGSTYTPYHYFEVYISVAGKWLTHLNTFFVFEFFSLPILVSLAQIQVVRVVGALFAVRQIPAVIWVFIAGTCFRFFHFGSIISWLKIHSLDYLNHFPLYAISSEHTLYFYSYIFKVSTFILLFSAWYYAVKKEDRNLEWVVSSCAAFVNLVFLPFFITLTGLRLISRRKLNWDFLVPILGVVFLGAFYFLNNVGNEKLPEPATQFPGFVTLFRLKDSYHSALEIVNFPFANYYPLVLLSVIGFWLLKKEPRRLSLLVLVLIFPFLFLSFSALFKIFLVLLALVLAWNSRDWMAFFQSDRPVVFAITALLSLAFVNTFLYSFFDFYQVWFMPMVGLIVFLPSIYLARIPLNSTVVILLSLFLVNNLSVLYFYYHRISLPGNPKPFVTSFLKKTGGRFTKGVYVSSLPARPYIYIGRTGYDVQNQSDSLYLTFISFDQLSQADTARLLRIKAWSFYQKFPFVRFYNRHKDQYALDDCKRLFMKENGVSCVFRSKSDPRSLAGFANGFMTDSLYDRKEMSWVYFLDTNRLRNWTPLPKSQ